jgi:hypothetical protein
MGMVAAFITVGLLAVAVTGVMNTFSDGETLTAGKLNTNFNSLKAAIENINTRLVAIESLPTHPTMRLIYETDVTSATTSVNVTGLNGDVDNQYMILTEVIGNATASLFIQPNNDSTSTNYGHSSINTLNGASPNSGKVTSDTGLTVTFFDSGRIGKSVLFLNAKSGKQRVAFSSIVGQVNGTDVYSTRIFGSTWNNTSSNITSLTFISSQANGIGAGSHIEVWARR